MKGDLLFWHEHDLWDRLIQWRTHGPFNHVEVITEDDNSMSFGAKPPGGVNYHRVDPGFMIYPVVEYPPGDYRVLVATNVTTPGHDAGVAWAETLQGAQYDWTDILLNLWAVFFPHGPFPKTPAAWTCSELAATYLVKAGSPYAIPTSEADLQVITPNDLFTLVTV